MEASHEDPIFVRSWVALTYFSRSQSSLGEAVVRASTCCYLISLRQCHDCLSLLCLAVYPLSLILAKGYCCRVCLVVYVIKVIKRTPYFARSRCLPKSIAFASLGISMGLCLLCS